MNVSRSALLAVTALALAANGFSTAAHAQGKTYPSYFGATPSASYYQMKNQYDQDTYMNPNPFPSYHSRGYDEPAYSPYARTPYAPAPAPPGFYMYESAYPTLGYYYGPGPFVYSHYDRTGRMAFRYGWW